METASRPAQFLSKRWIVRRVPTDNLKILRELKAYAVRQSHRVEPADVFEKRNFMLPQHAFNRAVG